ncbi:HlyD family type I secretion periplasmic adaptor subunit [Rhodoblastus acidophilus]|uniref:Membrane fusion protein (MFP) family protein n=1 Tax=Candidatus Rhodoblastus alkanivorans TaxID=2954117 RepID=A0ABS9ZBI1_9HYPH|nr:HlyD family type I secretion periplasmic adaptor subunit [Candidatus Rhodoblastus alkanivorans]MCI4677038.1 HlyD family type I secretion periplasmic adaptor subunit [Candidatus Rhodoblastus alkanivorans]MCI4684391.1 HlyD family type I secretion periplasmic adaptor subunit [Candidatus Rhodoblastus alkanivorans]MDI4641712.1 HlyD family type I secretion periplasmic adaptor subunit [Rhodoblastus acidophilus]
MERVTITALHSIQRHLVVGMILVGFVTFGVGGWAATARIAGAVIGEGVVVVDSSVKKVQHATGGVVAELRVRDGDRVKAGEVLVRLDPTQTLANATTVSQSLDQLLAREARLEAERDSSDAIVFPAALLDRAKKPNSEAERAIVAERKLFDLRRQSRSGQKAQLKERTSELQDEIKGYSGQGDAKQKEVELIHQELDGVRALYAKKLIPLTRLTALERDAARLEGERSQLSGMIAQTKGKIAETQLQIIQIDQDLRSEVGKDLIETRSKLSELAERKIAADDQLNRIDIRAPQSGRVHELAVHTVGGVIEPGQQIMLIVPDDDALAVEVKFAPRDINEVHVGQKVQMRFTAFDQKTTPEIEGKIGVVSADLITDQRSGHSYYTARVELNAQELAKIGSLKVVPGMPVEVFIESPERTVLSYLTKPLLDQAAHAMKER